MNNGFNEPYRLNRRRKKKSPEPETPVSGQVIEDNSSGFASSEDSAPPETEGCTGFSNPEATVRDIVRDVDSLPRTFEFPGGYFAILRERLCLDKGAFLLLSQDGATLSPWGICGFDQTSSYRLTVPVSIFHDLYQSNECTTFLLEGSAIEVFRPYFSSRDFASLRQVLVSVHIYHESILGVLLVAESPLVASSRPVVSTLLAALESLAAKSLRDARECILERNPAGYHPAPGQLKDLEDHISFSNATKGSFQLLQIDFFAFLSFLTASKAREPVYRLFLDCVSYIQTLLPDRLLFVNHARFQVFILFEGAQSLDRGLFCAHLEKALAKVFGKSGPEHPLRFTTFSFPETSREQLVTRVFS